MNDPHEGRESHGGVHMTEAEAERLQARHELLLDRVHARFRRERTQRLREIFGEEMERMREEEERAGHVLNWEMRPADPDDGANLFVEDDDFDCESDEEAEGEETDDPRPEHPVAKSARELAEYLGRELTGRKLIPRDASLEHPLVELGTSAFKAALKLDVVLH